MADVEKASGGQNDTSGWSLAAVFGLLVIAFAWEHVMPSANNASPSPQRSDGAHAPTSLASDDRGRQAASPSEIPPKGWKDILLRVYGNISKHRILALAAGMTYYSIL